MNKENIDAFDFKPGKIIGGRYTVIEKLGAGYEGEVYKVAEILTKQPRAIKLFYPQRNKQFKISTRNAQKLEKLNGSPLIITYHSHEIFRIKGQKIACLVCEFVEGAILGDFVTGQRSKRLGIFPSIHLLYSLVCGLEHIHLNGEYHGDLHTDNIIIKHFGLEFDIKIIDFHHWGDSKKDNRDEDIVKTIRIFYDILGGAKYYKKMPPSIKYIICGLKRNLILQRFKTVSHLRAHLELMDWSDAIQ
jgi:tRNA A-37 threonylcarbamoyl transferase component Bud32